jgi:hypothetical protein
MSAMNGTSGSAFVANATYIRLNAERGAQLEVLGSRVCLLAEVVLRRMLRESTQAKGNGHVPGVGG